MFECLLWRYGSAVACCKGRGCGCSRPGYGISPLGGGRHKPHHRAARTYTGLGKQTLGGHKQNLVCTSTQKNGAVIPQETDPDLPMSVQSLLNTHRQVWISLLWGHCSFLLSPGAHKFFFVPSKSLFPHSCISSGGSVLGLMAITSKRAYATPRSAAPRAPVPVAVHC